MIESYLEDGNQPVDGGVFGKSITDPCLGWEKTDYLIHEIAERCRLRRFTKRRNGRRCAGRI